MCRLEHHSRDVVPTADAMPLCCWDASDASLVILVHKTVVGCDYSLGLLRRAC